MTANQTDFEAKAAPIRQAYLKPRAERPASTARGVHHMALICSDVERTIQFYQGILGFPLIELMENRDYPNSSHLFFDIGNGNLLAFFERPVAAVLGVVTLVAWAWVLFDWIRRRGAEPATAG